MDEEKQRAAQFKALGDPTRLRIFTFLSQCCCAVIGDEGEVRPVEGPTVGEVCCSVTGADKITSTVSFHLKELRNAGLIAMERRGKNMVCCVDGEAVKKLSAFLLSSAEASGCCG